GNGANFIIKPKGIFDMQSSGRVTTTTVRGNPTAYLDNAGTLKRSLLAAGDGNAIDVGYSQSSSGFTLCEQGEISFNGTTGTTPQLLTGETRALSSTKILFDDGSYYLDAKLSLTGDGIKEFTQSTSSGVSLDIRP